MTTLLDDRSRFEAILELLSEDFVHDLVNNWLCNAYYPVGFLEVFVEYAKRKSEILSEFSNSKINATYQNFNKHFDELRKFLIDAFYIPQHHYGRPDNLLYRYLCPRFHHNFRLYEGDKEGEEEKDEDQWYKYKEGLDKLSENFEAAYKNFLKVARIEIGGAELKATYNPELNQIPIPEDAKWEDIKIKFLDGHNIKIKCKEETFDRNYKELGFENAKPRKPNKQWESYYYWQNETEDCLGMIRQMKAVG